MSLAPFARFAVLCVAFLSAMPAPARGQQAPDAAAPPTSDSSPRPGPMPQADRRARPSAGWVEPSLRSSTYRIGPEDVLSVSVLQAPELNTSARVSDTGEISLPLLGAVPAMDLTTQELELEVERRLREKYIRDPDVTIQVSEVRSHAVSVVGAVKRPGILQIHGATSLLEVLTLAGGLAEEAGDTILIVRPQAPATTSEAAPPAAANPAVVTVSDPALPDMVTLRVKVKLLIDARDPAANVPVFPGDVVNVQNASLVYVIGAVNKPGAFAMRGNERLTVLRALALGEGLTVTAAKGDAVVMRTTELGDRVQIPVDLNRVLSGTLADVTLQEQDVLFVPTSGGKVATLATLNFIARVVTLRGVLP